MSKRTSGLGRGLGDLLADNSPEIRGGATVIRRNEDGEATVTPDISDGVELEKGAEIYADKVKNDANEIKAPTVTAEGSAEDTQTRIIIGGSTHTSEIDPFAAPSVSGASASETRPPHRSLKALFKSYK